MYKGRSNSQSCTYGAVADDDAFDGLHGDGEDLWGDVDLRPRVREDVFSTRLALSAVGPATPAGA